MEGGDQVTYKEGQNSIWVNNKLEVRREWNNVKSVRANDLQPGILYPAILSFRVKIFSDIEVLKKYEVYESFAQN